MGATTSLSVPNGVDTGTIGVIPTGNFPSTESTGMFTFQKVYGIRDALDGTTNTIAYSEGVVNPATTGKGIRNIGVNNVGMSAAARVNVPDNPAAQTTYRLVRRGLADRHQSFDNQKGRDWPDGYDSDAVQHRRDAERSTSGPTAVTPARPPWPHSPTPNSFHPGGVN